MSRAHASGSRRWSSSTIDDGAAGAQDAEHVGHRHVRFQVGQRQLAVLRPDLEVPVEEFQRVHHRVVGELHPLGSPVEPEVNNT